MDINNIVQAMQRIDDDRDEIARGKNNSITPAIGSHLDIEGSTGEGKFSKIQEVVLNRT